MTNKKRLVLPGILAGAVILVLSALFKSTPELEPSYDNARLVDVMALRQQSSAPVVIGYGRVEPKHVWQAISEVSGSVIRRHEQLETGRFLAKDTLVLEVDPLEYELKLAQAEANLNSSRAQLTRLEHQAQNLQQSLLIEQKKLALAEQEFKRKQNLNKQGLVSNSELESEEQSLLAQRYKVLDLDNQLSLVPDDRKVNEAQIKVNQAQFSDAQRQLDKTRFTLPFDARIAAVNIEQQQAVSLGSMLFEAHQLGTVEVKAEFSLQDVRKLAASFPARVAGENGLPSIETLALQAHIELDDGDIRHRWPAQVTRISEAVNPNQATVGIYLEVAQDFRTLNLIKRPPLTQGMFVTATVQGFATEQFVVPERALHGDSLYIMDDEDQLAVARVQVLYRSPQGTAVTQQFTESGAAPPGWRLKSGDRVVLNDLIPAVPGMKLRLATTDTQLAQAGQ